MENLLQGLINRKMGWLLNLMGFIALFYNEGAMALLFFSVALFVFLFLLVDSFVDKGEN